MLFNHWIDDSDKQAFTNLNEQSHISRFWINQSDIFLPSGGVNL